MSEQFTPQFENTTEVKELDSTRENLRNKFKTLIASSAVELALAESEK